MKSAANMWKGRLGWGGSGLAAGLGIMGAAWVALGDRTTPPPANTPTQLVLPVRQPQDAPLQQLTSPQPIAAGSSTDAQPFASPPSAPPAELPASTPGAAPVSMPEVATTPAQNTPQPVVQQPVPPQPASTSSATRKINVNAASLAELDLLPGIGPALGQRIIDERVRGGRFTSLRDLQRVKGIGPRTAEKLKGLVVFE